MKYGVTTNHILGMEVILSTGEIVQIGGCAYDPPGYDLRGALVGSEGTMGIVTEVTVRILPLPESIITLLVVYDDKTRPKGFRAYTIYGELEDALGRNVDIVQDKLLHGFVRENIKDDRELIYERH